MAKVRYGTGILKGTEQKLKVMDEKLRKLLTLFGAHYPTADTDRLFTKTANGGRGLISVED